MTNFFGKAIVVLTLSVLAFGFLSSFFYFFGFKSDLPDCAKSPVVQGGDE